jgi:hypothetical protein
MLIRRRERTHRTRSTELRTQPGHSSAPAEGRGRAARSPFPQKQRCRERRLRPAVQLLVVQRSSDPPAPEEMPAFCAQEKRQRCSSEIGRQTPGTTVAIVQAPLVGRHGMSHCLRGRRAPLCSRSIERDLRTRFELHRITNYEAPGVLSMTTSPVLASRAPRAATTLSASPMTESSSVATRPSSRSAGSRSNAKPRTCCSPSSPAATSETRSSSPRTAHSSSGRDVRRRRGRRALIDRLTHYATMVTVNSDG